MLARLRLILAGLLGALLLVSLAACGDDEDAGDSTATRTPATPGATVAPTARVPTGKLTIGWSTFGNESLSPVTESTVTQDIFLRAMFDPFIMIHYDPDADEPQTLSPSVALEWASNDDFTVWTFKIREGQRFHNGEVLDANDVKFSFELYQDEISTNPRKGVYQEMIEEIVVEDPTTVVFHLTAPSDEWPKSVSDLFSVPILPQDYITEVGHEEFAQNPVGSGPFRFVKQILGTSVTFEAVEGDHWRGTPHFKELEVRLIEEGVTRVNALLAGEVDLISIPMGSVSQAEGVDILAVPTTVNQWLVFGGLIDPTHPNYDPDIPWHDPLVRQAMNIAVDRQAIADSIFRGFAKPAAQTFMLPGELGFDTSLEVYPYDPEKAKELLAEAGYPNGFSLDMYIYDLPPSEGMPQMAEAVAAMLEEVGLDVNIIPTEYTTIRPPWEARDPKLNNAIWTFRLGFRDDWTSDLALFFECGHILVLHCLPEYETLLEQAEAGVIREERGAALQELFRLNYENYSGIPGVYQDFLLAYDGLDGWEEHGVPMNGYKINYELLRKAD